MQTTIGNGYRLFTVHSPAAGRPLGAAVFDIAAMGAPAILPGPRRRQASGAPPSAGAEDRPRAAGTAPSAGLDRIERKAAAHPSSGTARGKADVLATVGISVPFLAVFVLACLTLA